MIAHVTSFAEAVDPTLSELSREMVRELNQLMIEFGRHRRDLERGMILQLLDDMKLLYRHADELGFV